MGGNKQNLISPLAVVPFSASLGHLAQVTFSCVSHDLRTLRLGENRFCFAVGLLRARLPLLTHGCFSSFPSERIEKHPCALNRSSICLGPDMDLRSAAVHCHLRVVGLPADGGAGAGIPPNPLPSPAKSKPLRGSSRPLARQTPHLYQLDPPCVFPKMALVSYSCSSASISC